jgi:hypothetical protein
MLNTSKPSPNDSRSYLVQHLTVLYKSKKFINASRVKENIYGANTHLLRITWKKSKGSLLRRD